MITDVLFYTLRFRSVFLTNIAAYIAIGARVQEGELDHTRTTSRMRCQLWLVVDNNALWVGSSRSDLAAGKIV